MDTPQNLPVPQLSEEQKAFVKRKIIFMQAILQAVANGLDHIDGLDPNQFKILLAEFSNNAPIASGMPTIDFMIKNCGYKTVIFSHEFMQAFFGEYWREHGYQMLILPDPLSYLEQFIKPPTQQQEWKK